MTASSAPARRNMTRSLVLTALMAALTAICSQIQIPLPMVPINLALFAVHLSGALLGWKYGALSMVVYALLGVIGVPVFAGFGSGPAVLRRAGCQPEKCKKLTAARRARPCVLALHLLYETQGRGIHRRGGKVLL